MFVKRLYKAVASGQCSGMGFAAWEAQQPILRNVRTSAAPSSSTCQSRSSECHSVNAFDPRGRVPCHSSRLCRRYEQRLAFNDEDTGEGVDLSEHGTSVDENLHEIGDDLAKAGSHFQSMLKSHEGRVTHRKRSVENIAETGTFTCQDGTSPSNLQSPPGAMSSSEA